MNNSEKYSDEFWEKALEEGREVRMLTSSKNQYLYVFDINNNLNKYQEDFDLAISLSPLNTRETIILNYGIEQGKIEGNKDYNNLLKAMVEAYPRSKSEFVDFDTFCREVMNKL